MPSVLHVLPHPGGGAETYIDLLEELPGYQHRRVTLSTTRRRVRGAPTVIARWLAIKRLAGRSDLVHVHGDMAAMIAAPALSKRPLLITTHGLLRFRRSTGLKAPIVRRRIRTAVKASARTICILPAEREDLAAVLPPSLHPRLVVVPNGVRVPDGPTPERRAQLRRSLGLGDDEVTVLFVGQLEDRKNPLGAVEAVEAARGRGAKVVLLIAGGGPLEEEVSARRSEGVRPLGYRNDIADLYASADVFLLPSQREGLSFALLEAMAHGLPPIASDGPGHAETVGDTGILFPVGDMEALAERIVALAADRTDRARRGAAARERVRSGFSLETFLAGTRGQYEAALATARRVRAPDRAGGGAPV